MDISFIKLSTSKEEAWNLGDSPQANLHYTSQIQLKPLDPKPYRQVTSSPVPLGINLTNYTAELIRCRDEAAEDITNHVLLSNWNEEGINQFTIRLAYLPTDYGGDPVYLRITGVSTGSEEYVVRYYSNRFLVTNDNIELTSRIDYIDPTRIIQSFDVEGYVQSIRLRFYFDNPVSGTEVEKYTQITRGNQVINPRIVLGEYRQYKTQLFNKYTYERLARALYGGICWIDYIRNYIVEGMDPGKREGDTNVAEMEFVTDPNENDVLNVPNVIIAILRDWYVNIDNDINVNNQVQYYVTETQIL